MPGRASVLAGARLLIRMLLQRAVAAVSDTAGPWVELARSAGAEDAAEAADLRRRLDERDGPAS